MSTVTPPPFEAQLAELEQIVRQMEQGNQPLEDALLAFERGIALSRDCQQRLTQAEQRVKILLQSNATAPLTDFTATDEP